MEAAPALAELKVKDGYEVIVLQLRVIICKSAEEAAI
jgi:hypothetical protein